jgi:hypothetical protein
MPTDRGRGDRLLRVLSEKPTLMVSLPRNDGALAEAAVEGGADALKVHIRCHHQASGSTFGSLSDERAGLEGVLAAAGDRPVGIVAGAEETASPEEVRALREMGFDFLDLYAHHWPLWLMQEPGFGKVVSIDSTYALHEVQSLVALGMEVLEASVIPHDEYGSRLTLRDLARYRELRANVSVPIVVTSQRALRPCEAAMLTGELGMDGVMIGAVVTGKEAGMLGRVTEAFRQAIDSVAPCAAG